MQDIHFHPNYTTFNTSEVSNEYNLLNDFLSHSLMEDGGMYSNDDAYTTDPSLNNTMQTLSGSNALFQAPPQPNQMPPPSQVAIGNAISRPASGFPIDKARETYYMTAADPAGTDTPEERMKKLMKAKYDAGMLKPFNYVKGYARLQQFMDRNLQSQSRSRILKQLDRFRPLFRERMHNLSDMQLVYVEIYFEGSLMEYDRVFASMAIPACCWRRTGEIYRGNKEMAALIGVPIEHLRDVGRHYNAEEPFANFGGREGLPSTRSFPNNLWSVTGRNLVLLPSITSKRPYSRLALLRTAKQMQQNQRRSVVSHLLSVEINTMCRFPLLQSSSLLANSSGQF